MNCWNGLCRAFVMIALALTSLSGCGGGSSNGVVATATTTAPAVPVPPASEPDIEIPATPAGVAAVGGTNKVTISWNAVSNATSYNIYWATATGVTAASGTRIAVAGNSFIHRGLLPTEPYYYIVTAQNSTGESAAARQVAATTAALDGATPYVTYCAGCHGQLANSTVANKSVTEINTALQDVSPMSAVTLTLTDLQIAAISAALMYNN
jgi:cytochrome c553